MVAEAKLGLVPANGHASNKSNDRIASTTLFRPFQCGPTTPASENTSWPSYTSATSEVFRGCPWLSWPVPQKSPLSPNWRTSAPSANAVMGKKKKPAPSDKTELDCLGHWGHILNWIKKPIDVYLTPPCWQARLFLKFFLGASMVRISRHRFWRECSKLHQVKKKHVSWLIWSGSISLLFLKPV